MGTATTVEEARRLEAAGVVVAVALVPRVVDAVVVPVVAAGGIIDGRVIVAARALGAGAVQTGTASLACREARIPGGLQGGGQVGAQRPGHG